MSAKRKLRVFISYSVKDKIVVRRLYQQLLNEGWIDPWLDEEKVLPGQERNLESQSALEKSDVAITCLSKNSLAEESYVQKEMRSILDISQTKPGNSIFIVPIRLDKCEMPRPLRTWQYVDFSSNEVKDKNYAYNRLIKSLKLKYNIITDTTEENPSAHFVSSTQSQDTEETTISSFGGFTFVKIPKGKFIMGSKVSNDCAWDNEIPQRPYTISYDYWIARVPITNEQFGEFTVSTKLSGRPSKGWEKRLNYPVVNVSWKDAVDYAKWLNKVFSKEIPVGLVFRLPTEVEWERASRGDFAREWPWGNENLDELLESESSFAAASAKNDEEYFRSKKFSDYFAEAFGLGDSKVKRIAAGSEGSKLIKQIEFLRYTLNLIEVGSFSPLTDSPHKVADMMGSILEWTQTLYAPYPYTIQDGRENLEKRGKRVIKGFFTSNSERFSVRSARRGYGLPDKKEKILGFRIVIAPPT